MNNKKISLLAAATWLIIVTVLLCLPGTEFPKIDWLARIWFDKWVHIGLFLVLTSLWCWFIFFEDKTHKNLRNIFLSIAFLCLLYGAVMEIVQHFFIPFRSFDVLDIVADGVGSLCGYWFSSYRYIKK